MTWTELELEAHPDVETAGEHLLPDGCPVLLLTVESAAAKIGVHRTTMYHLVSSGQIESVRVGRLRRIPVACLFEYVAKLRLEAKGMAG